MSNVNIMGTACTMTLEDGGEYLNGLVTLADGRKFNVGGGNIHSAESASHENNCNGLQVDTHPEMHWPGAVSEGDFAAYQGYENGDLDKLAAALEIEIDRDTDEGDANWKELVADVQKASRRAFKAMGAKNAN